MGPVVEAYVFVACCFVCKASTGGIAFKTKKKTVKGRIYSSELSYNPNHRWFYLPEQRDDEVWFFKQGDSRAVNKEP